MLQKALNKEDIFTESFLNFYSKNGNTPKTFLNIFKKYFFDRVALLEDGNNMIINNPEKTFKELKEFNIYKYLFNGKLLYLSKQKKVFSVFIFY